MYGKLIRCQPTHQKDHGLPRPPSVQQRHQRLLTISDMLPDIAADVFGFHP